MPSASPFIRRLRKIARRSGCDLQWLLTGKHSNPVPRCIARLSRIMSQKKAA